MHVQILARTTQGLLTRKGRGNSNIIPQTPHKMHAFKQVPPCVSHRMKKVCFELKKEVRNFKFCTHLELTVTIQNPI